MFKIQVFIVCYVILSLSAFAQPELKNASADDILKHIQSFEGRKVVLVNYWATWCGPCREEFPYILRLKEMYGEEFELIFVSADFEEARSEAVTFLKEQGVDFTTFFKIGSDHEFINTVSDTWSGALPYTVIYDINGEISSEWEDKADFSTFESALLKAINKNRKP